MKKKKQYLLNKQTRAEYLVLAKEAKRMGLPQTERAWKLLANRKK